MSSEFFRVKKGLNISPSDSSTVTSPEVGDIIVDSSDNNKLKRYDDVTSSWKDVGSGAGGINYISNNSDFEGGTVGYATYADAAGEAPVDGTGGTATFVSIGTDSVSPLRGTKSGLISKTANNAQGQGVSYDFIIDPADQAQVLRISFDYSTSANYADGDIRVYIYDYFNLRLIEVVDRDLLASTQGKFVGTFQTSPDSLSYRLIFHVASVNALAYTVEVDNVIVGPQTIVKGAIVTDWEPCTVTWNGIPGTVTSFIRRVGDSADIKTAIAVTGAGTGLISFSVPTGLSVDTTKLLLNEFQANLRMRDQTGSTASYTGVVSYNGGTFQIAPNRDTVNAGTSYISVVNASATIPVTWASGDFIEAIVFGVPIQGWSSNVVLSEDAGNREIVAKYNIATTAIANTGTTIINFSNKQYDTSASVATGASWSFSCPESGYYDVGAKIRFSDSAAFTAGTRAALYVFVNGVQTSTLAFHELESSDAVSLFMSVNGSTILYLSKGDSVDFRAVQTTATASIALDGATIENYASIAKRSSPQTIAASEVVAAKYKQNSGQNMVVNFSNKIDFSIKVYDTHNAVTTGANWRFTAPQSGYYAITASALFESAITWTAGNRYQVDVALRNSAGTLITNETIAYKRIEATISTNVGPSNGSSTEVFMSKGDYIEITLSHNRTGGDASLLVSDTLNYVTISKISGV